MASHSIKLPAGVSLEQRVLQLQSDVDSHVGSARTVLHLVIDALPPEDGAKTANALDAVITLLDLAQQRINDLREVTELEVSHA